MTLPTIGLAIDEPPRPFLDLATSSRPQGPLRDRITEACRIPETQAVSALLADATLPAADAAASDALAHALVVAMRRKSAQGGVQGLIREYDLSSQEGVALMCLAEALLRIPDRATRDALIRDKISTGDWQAHLGRSPSLFVNAATWGLVVTGRLTATGGEAGLAASLTGLIGRGGEPVIRRAVDRALRMWASSSSPARPSPRRCRAAASRSDAASGTPTTCWARPR